MPFVAEDAARAIDQLAPIGAWLMHCTEDVHIVPGVGQSLGLLRRAAECAVVLALAKALADAALRCGRRCWRVLALLRGRKEGRMSERVCEKETDASKLFNFRQIASTRCHKKGRRRVNLFAVLIPAPTYDHFDSVGGRGAGRDGEGLLKFS